MRRRRSSAVYQLPPTQPPGAPGPEPAEQARLMAPAELPIVNRSLVSGACATTVKPFALAVAVMSSA